MKYFIEREKDSSMTIWQKALDAAVTGSNANLPLPPHIDFLSLPPLTRVEGHRVEIEWQAPESVTQGAGVIFGGYLSALADYIAGAAMLTVLKDTQTFATKRLETQFVKPVFPGDVSISAEVTEFDDKEARVEVIFRNKKGDIRASADIVQIIQPFSMKR